MDERKGEHYFYPKKLKQKALNYIKVTEKCSYNNILLSNIIQEKFKHTSIEWNQDCRKRKVLVMFSPPRHHPILTLISFKSTSHSYTSTGHVVNEAIAESSSPTDFELVNIPTHFGVTMYMWHSKRLYMCHGDDVDAFFLHWITSNIDMG